MIRLLISVPTPAAPTTPLSPQRTAPTHVLANVFVSAPAAGGGTMSFHDVPADCKLQRFKEKIYDRTGDDPENIRLIYAGKELEDNRNGTGMFKYILERRQRPNQSCRDDPGGLWCYQCRVFGWLVTYIVAANSG